MNKQLHSYEGIDLVKRRYVESTFTDTGFAAYATVELERPYSVAQIRQYRQVLGIANNTTARKPAERPTKCFVVTDEFQPVAVVFDQALAEEALAEGDNMRYAEIEVRYA